MPAGGAVPRLDTAVRDAPHGSAFVGSKAPDGAVLTVAAGTFAAFIDALRPAHSTVTDFARFRG
jgi:hypothetical protein